MGMQKSICIRIGIVFLAILPVTGFAADALTPWVFEAKVGVLEPDLPLYETFYGSSSDN